VAVAVIIFVLKIDRKNNPKGLTIFQRIQQLDLIGASILIPAIVCLLLALQWGGSTYAWKNSRIIGLFVGFGLLTIIFVASQIILGDKGILPPRFFKNRNVLAAMMFALFFGAGFFVLIFYVPIYFQSVLGSSATKSGIQLLPLLISCVLSSIVTGGLITALGYYVPFLIGCMIIFAIGSGLITLYDVHTPLGQWFGYQVLAGAGIGVGFQGGIVVVQTVLPLADIPIGTACISFFQTLGGALFVSVAQSIFQNGLAEGISEYTDLDPKIFLHSGATQIRVILKEMDREDALEGLLKAYVLGLRHCFYIAVACAIVALFAACCLEWKSVKKANQGGKKAENIEVDSAEVKKDTV
jgi:MFS family permease